MIARCHRVTDKNYCRYGARGISVCQRWRQSFQAFFDDMGQRPSDEHSIERANNDGNYEPSNCYWATIYEQNNNRRSNVLIEYNGRTQSIKRWCDELGISYHMTRQRICRRGWSAERA